MTPVPPDWLSWADFFAKCGQFMFGFVTVMLALWAAIFKRKEFFRTELTKKQLDELGSIRCSLQSIFFDFYYIPSTTQTMSSMGWNIDTLKVQDPDSWEQYHRYKSTSLELFYKFSDSNYYLFPEWIDKNKRQSFSEAMKKFAPFTLLATTSKSQAEREAYANHILSIKDHIDCALRAHA